MEFIQGIKESILGLTAEVEGLSYLPWATALAKAGRPHQRLPFVYRTLLDGAVVAVEQPIGEDWQRTWLPVLDGNNLPVPDEDLTSRAVGDAINRCRAKSVAMVNGVGLALYAGYGEDVAKFLKELGVRPDSDLAQIEPLTSTKGGKTGAEYVDWAAALAAARITDPEFWWGVKEFENISPDGEIVQEPYAPLPRGFMVAVDVRYKGIEHTEYLPIMGVMEVQTKKGLRKMDHQPLLEPNAFDWNRSVMRCLAKGVAVVSGYGLSVYAGEDIASLQSNPVGKKSLTDSPAQEPAKAVSDEMEISRREVLAKEVRNALLASGKDPAKLLAWLGKPADTAIESLDEGSLIKAHKALIRQAA